MSNFIYQEDVAKILYKVLNKKGIINIGGNSKLIYDFAKKSKKNIKKNLLSRRISEKNGYEFI